MKLIVGLGNPGEEYAETRHNAGALVARSLAGSWGVSFTAHKSHALVTSYGAGTKKIILAIPSTYMNASGEPVGELARFYKITLDDVIIIYDDIDLPFGSLRVSTNLSSGGHNGIKSIIQHLDHADFIRVRVGIGPNRDTSRSSGARGDAADFVLKKWTAGERKKLPEIVDRTVNAIKLVVDKGLTAAANEYNKTAN